MAHPTHLTYYMVLTNIVDPTDYDVGSVDDMSDPPRAYCVGRLRRPMHDFDVGSVVYVKIVGCVIDIFLTCNPPTDEDEHHLFVLESKPVIMAVPSEEAARDYLCSIASRSPQQPKKEPKNTEMPPNKRRRLEDQSDEYIINTYNRLIDNPVISLDRPSMIEAIRKYLKRQK